MPTQIQRKLYHAHPSDRLSSLDADPSSVHQSAEIVEYLMQTVKANLYDYPQYYDLVFGSDWKAERDFLMSCFDEHPERPVKRIFEPACGTGRLMFRLAREGYQVSGLDLNHHAVKYCNDRLERHGYARSAMVGDMSCFELPRRVDAAFNTINSFRHLLKEKDAVGHLECVAESLKKGGIYVLGLHLTPTEGTPMTEESWSARRGHLGVNTHLQTTASDARLRQERCRMRYDVFTPSETLRFEDEIVFRTYTAAQFRKLLAKVPAFHVVATYDFRYDLDEPIEVRPSTEDVVFVLRTAGRTR